MSSVPCLCHYQKQRVSLPIQFIPLSACLIPTTIQCNGKGCWCVHARSTPLFYVCMRGQIWCCISYKRLLDLFFLFCHKGNFFRVVYHGVTSSFFFKFSRELFFWKILREFLFFFKRRAKCTKRGPMPPFLGKRGLPPFFEGLPPNFWYQKYWPSFPSVWYIGNTGEIPTEYQPKIPRQYVLQIRRT